MFLKIQIRRYTANGHPAESQFTGLNEENVSAVKISPHARKRAVTDEAAS